MKNPIINIFLLFFPILNLLIFDEIVGLFWLISDIFWEFVKFDVVCVILACLCGLTFVVFFVYFLLHRDKKDMVCPVEFNSPNDMTPLELGFLVDGVVDGEDLSSLLVFWASKNFLEISKDKENPKLTKLVDELPPESNSYEKKLFGAIFGKSKEVSVEQIGEKLSNSDAVTQAVGAVSKDIGGQFFQQKILNMRQLFVVVFSLLYYVSAMYLWLEFVDKVAMFPILFIIFSTFLLAFSAGFVLHFHDYRHQHSKQKGRLVSILCLIALVLVCAGMVIWLFWVDTYQVIFLVSLLAIFLLVVLMSCKMQIYTKQGVKKLGQVLGFKHFLEVAEKDRIQMLAEEDPNVFYQVLPYAFVLGVSDKWISNLNVVKTEIPLAVKTEMLEDMMVTSYIITRCGLVFNPLLRFARFYRFASSGRTIAGRINRGGGFGGGSRGSRGGGGHHG